MPQAGLSPAATLGFPTNGATPQCPRVDGPTPIPWYYAESGEQRGPFAPPDWEALLASGTVSADTLVWHEGLEDWVPWGTVGTVPTPPPMLADPGEPPVAGDVRCSECGQTFPEDDTIPHGHRRICAACKLPFLQRLAEGAPLGRADGQHLTLEQVVERDYPLGIGRAFNRGWEVFQTEPWMLMAAFATFSAVMLGAMLAGTLVGMVIPFASSLVGLFVNTPLSAGLFLIILLRIRGEAVQFQPGFRGFGPRYWQLTLFHLAQSAMLLGFSILLVLGLLPVILLGAGTSLGGFNPPIWAIAVLFAFCTLMATVAVVGLFYFLVSWMFAGPLILDKGLDFWPAMKLSRRLVNRHPWRFSLMVLVVSTMGMFGLFLCGIGVFVTGTLAAVMLATVYEDMFGGLDPRRSH